MKNKICIIGQFPPPIHGLSKAIETLYNSRLSDEYDLTRIDLTNNHNILNNLFKICFSKNDVYYLTISQSTGGNLRDLLIMGIILLKSKKVIIHLHGGYYRTLVDSVMKKWQRILNYKLFSKVSAAVVLGPSLVYNFKGMVPEDRIFTVPNCIDDDYLIDNAEYAQKVQAQHSSRVVNILFLSNFILEKGYRAVLSLASAERDNKQYHFDFAGAFFESTQKSFFEEYVKLHGLSKNVTYHGIVSGEKKRLLLKKADVFILLTTYPKEGQPISIIEAMGNGAVVIASKFAGIPDLINDDNDGFLISPKNGFEINKIRDILNSVDYSDIGQRARRKVLNSYTENNYIDGLSHVFQFVLLN